MNYFVRPRAALVSLTLLNRIAKRLCTLAENTIIGSRVIFKLRFVKSIGAIAAYACVLIAAYASMLIATAAFAAPVQLDSSFGTDGTTTIPMGPRGETLSVAALQPDGKLFVGGQCGYGPFCFTRLNADGTRDLAFLDSNDYPQRAGGNPSFRWDVELGAAFQADGKTLVAGACESGGAFKLCVIRLNVDGSSDLTFGLSGTSILDIVEGAVSNTTLFLQPDGAPVVVTSCGAAKQLCAARLLESGALDTSFADAGRLVSVMEAGASGSNAAAMQADGKLLAHVPCGSGSRCVRRYNLAGQLDATFGAGGSVTLPAAIQQGSTVNTSASQIAAHEDGTILAIHSCTIGNSPRVCGAKLGATGAIDNTFGTAGTFVSDVGVQLTTSKLIPQAGGGFYLAGLCSVMQLYPEDCVSRYLSNGQLDTAFNGTGHVQTGMPSNYRPPIGIAAADGKFTLVTSCVTGGMIIDIQGGDLCVRRYQSSGQPDAGYGINGKVRASPGLGAGWLYSSSLLPDGKLLLFGTCEGEYELAHHETGLFTYRTCIARLTSSGALDTTFGFRGRVVIQTIDTQVPVNADTHAIAVQADGKIVIAEHCRRFEDGGGSGQTCVVRLLPDGALDTTFNGTGKLVFPDAPAGQVFAVLVQTDGKIVVAGSAMVLMRLNADGTRDTAFGASGVLSQSWGGGKTPTFYGGRDGALALQPDGKLLFAGRCNGAQIDVCMARALPNGTLDASFNGSGVVKTSLTPGHDAPVSLTVLPDGKILLSAACDRYGCMARYNADGSLDTTLGGGGIVVERELGLLVPLPEGMLLSIGRCGEESCLSRWHPDGRRDISFNDTGSFKLTAAGQTFSVRDAALAPDGKVVAAVAPRNYLMFGAARLQAFPAPMTQAFTFVQQTNVPISTDVTSNAIAATGFTGQAPISVSGGSYSIGCTAIFATAPGTINAGDTVCVRHTSAATQYTTTGTTLTIGSGSGIFLSVTGGELILTVERGGNGQGTVTATVGGIDCGANCTALLLAGTQVTFTATPAPGHVFTGFYLMEPQNYASCPYLQTTCTLTITVPTRIAAGFERIVTATVAKSGAGQGLIENRGGSWYIHCGLTCSDDVYAGYVYTAYAYSFEGYVFLRWEGCDSVWQTRFCDFAPNANRKVTAVFGVSPTGIPRAHADFNGDGRSDLLWHNSATGMLYAMQMNGLSVGPSGIVDQEPDSNWRIAAVVDLNGDAKADIVWRNQVTGQVYGMLMDGLNVTQEGMIHIEPNLDWQIIGANDFRFGVRAYLLWRNGTTGEIYRMGVTGVAREGGGVIYRESDPNWKVEKVADFDGNGYADILWRHAVSGTVVLTRFDYDGYLSGSLLYREPNMAWEIRAVADFDGDGKMDVLWRNANSGEVYMQRTTGVTGTDGAFIYAEPDQNWQVAATGDYNGDGRADILWRNTSTGQVFMMLMNGFTISGGDFVYTEPDQNWKIVGP